MSTERKIYPLSSSELGIYLDNPETTAYNLSVFMRLWPDADIVRVKDALRRLSEVHPHIFMRVCVDDEGNVGKYIEKFDFDIPEVRLDSIKDFEVVPFTILDAPLFRFGIYRIGGEAYLYFEFHHIVIDGTGQDVFIKDFLALYDGKEVAEETCSAEAFALEEVAARGTQAYADGKAYYESRFGGVECSSTLPFDKSDGAPRYARLNGDFAVKNAEVNRFVKSKKIKTSTFFISVYTYLLSKMNMEKEALVCTVHNGRNEQVARSLGMFVKTMPFYARYDDETTVEAFLAENNVQMVENVNHNLYSFVDISRDLGVASEEFFGYQGDMYSVERDGKALELLRPAGKDGTGNSNFLVFRSGDSFGYEINYRTDVYEESTMRHLARLVDRVAQEFLIKEKLSDINLLSEEEAATLDGFNQIDESLMNVEKTVIDGFYDSLERAPQKVLIEFEDKRYTYAEVDSLTNKIANRLLAWGIGRENVVSVLIPKCEYTVIASLGVLKATAAYQPLDPSYPPERLNFMMKDSDAKAVILDRALEHIIEGYSGHRLYLDEIPALEDDARPAERPRPQDLFNMLYTSGTTGLPKGVMIEHRGVATMCAYYIKQYDCDGDMKSSSYASYGFDAHMIDLYPTIVAGGTICVIPEKMRLDLVALGEYFNTTGITHTIITTQVGRQFLEEIELKTLKHFMVGGEKLVPVEPAKGFTFHNAYGPTEGTVFCSEQPVDKLYYRVPIGKKLSTYKAYIVDEKLRLQPWGVKGELCIAGPQVARGYLNREAENKKAFVANPFDSDSRFGKMYRTGDVVRMLKDGTLDFIGRNDGQVKIRGFRVELTEVEQIIRKFPDIKDVTVKDFTDPSGIKFIVAYVVSDKAVDVDALNAFIGKNKPPYMIPAFTMQIDKIPLNQNQKVNKRALPQPEMKAAEMVPPEGEAEQKIYDLLVGILGHKSFGVTTDFYAAGLSSVTAIKFNVQLSKAFGKTLKTSDIADNSTVRALAAFLAGAEEDVEYDVLKEYPLTKLQEGIFVECTTQPNTTVYNIPLLLKLDPSVDIRRLERALETVIDAHPYLKARLKMTDGGDIVAVRDDERKIAIDTIDLSTVEGGVNGLVKPFDLTHDDLIRAAIVRGDPDTYLFVDAHHIVFDGESLVVFMRELDEACRGVTPVRERYTGFEVALAEAERLKSEAYQKAKAYYEELLGAVDTECMPIRDRDEGKDRGVTFSVEAKLDKKALGEFLSGGATEAAMWNAAFGYALSKFLAREDCVYTTVYNGRSDSRLLNSVGMYVHTLPMVYRNEAGERGKDAVLRVAKELTDNMRNDIYPFAEISRNFGVKANVMFVYEGNIGVDIPVDGKPTESVILKSDALKADLSFFVFETADGFRLDCEYNARYYEEWSIRSLVESTIMALNALVRNESTDAIRLLSSEEKARLDEATFEAHEVEDTDIVTLFRRMAEAYPEHNAVIFRDKHITYRELDSITDNVAADIQARGIGKEDVVSILVPRGEYMVIAALGVLKAGAAYEPLDPSYPSERLSFMVQNAHAKLVIADAELTQLLPSYYGDYLLLDEIPALPEAKPKDPELNGDNLFIVLYTSGTTGTPKGVMLEHRNLVNFATWYREHYGLTPDSVAAAYASFGFDADMMDLYPALTSGAAVYIIPEDMRLDLGTLDKAFEENRVSHVFMTTQMGRMFAENMPGHSLKHLSVGGETLAPLTPPKGFALWNGYGPTECTIFSTIWKIDRLYYRNPIGRALWNYRLYVVGKNGEELPVGALGELWIAGAGVGRGYLDLPEQTKKVFIPNPFDKTIGFDRVYRTGDVVRRLADGSIDFVGRNDGQVKIRGFRIELTEVEGVIREYEGVKNVTVQAFEDKAFGGKYLAAYVVSDSEVDFGALAAFIKSKKPPYMVPAAFMQLDAIPLNQNQKVNKRALPLPKRTGAETRTNARPAGGVEQEICKMFAGVLGLDVVEPTDNFFDLGGTSISAAKVVMMATQKQYPIAYKDVFDNPTARQLAKHIEGVNGPAETANASDLEGELCKMFAGVLGLEEVAPTDNFFDIGGTSISAAKVVMMATGKQYPVAYKDVFDNPTAKDLARHIREESGPADVSGAEQAEEVEEEALKHNVVRLVNEVADVRPLGRTLLAGATGFLGSHILRELLQNGIETVVLCRGNKDLDAPTRLSAMYAYYFDAPIEAEQAGLVKVINGDITNTDLVEILRDEHIDTIINSAACVKHFAADDIIERINVGGVLNLIEVAKAHKARLIQISTLSVAGENVDNKFPQTFKMGENKLYFGQDISNKYVNSKFKAEEAIIRAIDEGLDAKMIRAGNLMGRQSDGEFQINSITNSFIKSLRAYKALGYFPVSACDSTVDFSPIDEVARAVVLLAKTDKRFTVFHAANSHEIQMGDVIEEMNRHGFHIQIVPDEVFADKMAAFMQDGERSMLVSSLLTYSSSDHHVHTFIKSDNTFTIKALYRLGFKWPITDGNYLGRVIEGLASLGYFDRMDI